MGGPISQPPNIIKCGHPLKCECIVYNKPIIQTIGLRIERIFFFINLDELLYLSILIIRFIVFGETNQFNNYNK